MTVRWTWLWIAGCLWLSACGSPDDDLRAWMERTHKRHHNAPPALPLAPAAALLRYEPGGRADPFSAVRLNVLDDTVPDEGLQPDLRRTREPLESYSLASLRLIGSLRRGRDAIALIEVDQRVYTVRVGSHLGQDFGKVVAIGERTIEVDELVAESGGRWVQRRSQLALQETP